MHLYLIRHAEAVPRDEAPTDVERPLTPRGQSQCLMLARALRELGVSIETLLTSPLVRARQTADGIVAHWGEGAPSVRECEYLAPGGKKRKLLRELLAAGGEGIGLVGHNPDLSELVAWMISDKAAGIDLCKAGVACIAFNSSPCKGTGVLEWLATADLLQQIAG